MNAINDKNFKDISLKMGKSFKLTSENNVISSLFEEIQTENKTPLNLTSNSNTDESVNKYFKNSYAYVRFSK